MIEITQTETEQLKQLITEFNSYYEEEKVWEFDDLDNQRLIGVEIVKILDGKI